MRTTSAGWGYLVESDFEHNGLRCVAVLMEMGHRNGYVGVPESHPLYGEFYDGIDNICVHGGLTFSSISIGEPYPIETDPPLWWFGFDCNHSFDIPEYGGSYKDTLYVENECKRLAEQLSEVKGGQS